MVAKTEKLLTSKGCVSTFPAAVIKNSDQSKPEDRKEFVLAHRSRMSIMVGKALWQEPEEAGHIASSDRKHK